MTSNEHWSESNNNNSSRLVVAGSAVNESDVLHPPPPPTNLPNNQWEQLPPGWASAYSAPDGRIYYWEKSTGKTSWTHPMMITITPPPIAQKVEFVPTMARTSQSGSTRDVWNASSNNGAAAYHHHDTPLNASRRPDNHQCYAAAALILCFPVGFCAVYQSCMVDRSWSRGNYGDAVNHSRQASQYACFGNALGVSFWIWFLFFDEMVRMADWFKFDN
jgi:hypothetical protein